MPFLCISRAQISLTMWFPCKNRGTVEWRGILLPSFCTGATFTMFPTVEPTASYCDHAVWSAILFPYSMVLASFPGFRLFAVEMCVESLGMRLVLYGVHVAKIQEIALKQPDWPLCMHVSLGMRLGGPNVGMGNNEASLMSKLLKVVHIIHVLCSQSYIPLPTVRNS